MYNKMSNNINSNININGQENTKFIYKNVQTKFRIYIYIQFTYNIDEIFKMDEKICDNGPNVKTLFYRKTG